MAERPLRPLAEVVVMEDRVLNHAEDRANRGAREDHRDQRVAARAAEKPVRGRHDQEEHELLAVDEARHRIRRERGRHERRRRIGGQRPEKRRRLEALAPHDQHDRPADEGNQEQELRDRDRELQRARDHDQRDRADLFETFGGDRMRHVERERVVHGPTSYPVRLKPDTMYVEMRRDSSART